MRVTFLRSRPADSLAEPTAMSRRREGTTVIEIESPLDTDLAAGVAGTVLVSGSQVEGPEPAAWVVGPEDAIELARNEVSSWRITVRWVGRREAVLDALARTQASYLRVRRSEVA